MSLLVTVVTHDSTYVLFVLSPLSTPSDLGCVDSGGRGGGILGFPRTPLISPVFLLVLLGFLGRLGLLGGSGCGSGCGAFRSLGVIPTMVFPHSLGLDLVRGDVSGSISSEDLEISLSHVGTWS